MKIYGVKAHLAPLKEPFSDVLHACAVEALHLPPDKRFHRFFLLDAFDFFFPPDRSTRYTILENSLFEGRSVLPAHLSTVVEKLFSRTLWHPTARMRLIQFLFHTYGVREVASALKAKQSA